MPFEPFGLHDWLLEHEERVKLLLAHSGVQSASLADLGVTPEMFLRQDLGYGTLPAAPALTAKVGQVYGLPPEQVLVTLAGSEADLLAFLATVGPGDKVVVETPTYPPLRAVPRALGALVVDHHRTWDQRFRLDLARLEDDLKGAKLFVLANLNNPTGVGVSRRELEEVHRIAERRGCLVLVDEAFRELGTPPPPVAATLGERFLSTNTLTKCYGLAGLRTGWLLASRDLVARAAVAKSYLSIGQPVLEQRLALLALGRRDALLRRAAGIRDGNLATMRAWLASQDRVAWVAPDGGLICAPRLPEGVDDVAFGRALVAQRDTLVAPGSLQGLPGHVRIGLGGDAAHFGPGLRNLGEVLAGMPVRPPARPPRPAAATPAPGAGAGDDALLEEHLGSKGGDV